MECLCGSSVRRETTQPGYDYLCGGCGENIKLRNSEGLCPIDPLYCNNFGSHRCFNEDEWRGGIVIRKIEEPDTNGERFDYEKG